MRKRHFQYLSSFHNETKTFGVLCYLGFVQKAKDNVVVGVGPHHNGMGGDTGHVAPAVLSDFSSRIVRTEQLKFTGRQVYRPRICVVAWK